MPFDINTFVNDCRAALESDRPQESIAELLRDAVSEPDAIINGLVKSDRAMVERLYVSDSLTIINVIWAPKMTLRPHNHNTWAVIGVYAGREDNIFWRPLKDDPEGKIEAAGAKSIAAGEVVALGKNLIHSVTNPTSSFTRAIHVYGGNFFELARSEWEPVNLVEQPYDVAKTLALFEAENALLKFRKEEET